MSELSTNERSAYESLQRKDTETRKLMRKLLIDKREMKAINAELLEACESMIRIKDLWIPEDCDHLKEEHRDENIALVRGLRKIEQAIKKATA